MNASRMASKAGRSSVAKDDFGGGETVAEAVHGRTLLAFGGDGAVRLGSVVVTAFYFSKETT
jgi:hypothetical protein